jgi:hypothetical protein
MNKLLFWNVGNLAKALASLQRGTNSIGHHSYGFFGGSFRYFGVHTAVRQLSVTGATAHPFVTAVAMAEAYS